MLLFDCRFEPQLYTPLVVRSAIQMITHFPYPGVGVLIVCFTHFPYTGVGVS